MRVIGHAGAAGLAPGNTWRAIDAALACGVDAVEIDLRATRDGVVVLFHDEDLAPCTEGRGRLRDHDWAEVRRLDAGHRYPEPFRGTPLAELETTLKRYGGAVDWVFEIKETGIEERVLDLVALFGLQARSTVTSFLWSVCSQVKRLRPEVRVGYLTHEANDAIARRIAEARFEQFCPPAHLVDRASVSCWRGIGLEVRVWGVYDDDLMRRAIEAGVDGMTINDPRPLLSALGRAGDSASRSPRTGEDG